MQNNQDASAEFLARTAGMNKSLVENVQRTMSSDRKRTFLWEQLRENFGLYFQKKNRSQLLIQTHSLTLNRLVCFGVFCGAVFGLFPF